MLRPALIALGAVGAACVMTVNVRYAIATSDTPVDAAIAATYVATITLVGLTFHAVALHTWRASRFWSVLIGFVAIGAMLVSLSNSLGFMAVRGAQSTAEIEMTTTSVADARAELEALRARRQALPIYPPTTAAQVEAAQSAVSTAAAQREAECSAERGGRGGQCRDREADERSARDRLIEIEQQRAATVTAEDIEARIAATMLAIEKEGPVRAVNAQAAALATLLALPQSWTNTISTWQQAMLVILMELAVIISLIAAELIGRKTSPNAQSEALTIHLQLDEGEVGTAKDFAVANLWPHDQSTMTLIEAHGAYRQWCSATGMRPLPALDFAQDFFDIVKGLGLAITKKGEAIEITGARIAQTPLLQAAE